MSKGLTWYFMLFGVSQAVGAWHDWSAGYPIVYALVGMAACLGLAVGMYGKYRLARIAGICICTIMTGMAVLFWCESAFQQYLHLLGAVIFGLPLIALLHPKARAEFTRKVRA